jgi:hypothetical protein
MDDCCDTAPTARIQPPRAVCPSHGKSCASVSRATVLHHLARAWQAALAFDSYYFCDDPDCSVVYFAIDGSVFDASAVRTEVGQKRREPDATLCYCFGITYSAAASDPAIRQFVVTETKRKSCACGSRNPSGVCCLKYFPNAGAAVVEV